MPVRLDYRQPVETFLPNTSRHMFQALLDEVNTVRQLNGLPNMTMTDLTDKAKAKLQAKP